METLQTDKICRACLQEDEKMIDMSEKDIYQKFLLFANLTAEKEIPDVPLNLCQFCEQKLNISLDFREECQKSHKILLNYVVDKVFLSTNYINNSCEVDSEADVDTPADILQASDVDTPDAQSEATDVGVKKLVQFPQSQVLEAINNVKQNIYKKKKCIRCRFVGNQSTSLSIHVSRVHKDLKSRWCCVCNAEFDDLTDHVATNHSDDYTCKFCSKKFVKLKRLTAHLRKHSDVMPFRCLNAQTKKSEGDADKQLAALELKKHKRVHTESELHKCTYCDKKLQSHSQLLGHERIHTGERPYVCQVCEKRFTLLGTLKTHMIKIHNKERKIICNICEKKFYWPFELRQHLLKHTGEKPFVCTECGKGFNQHAHLTEHNQIHSNLCPYQCSQCKKSFKKSDALKRHMWIHTGEKPYKCNQCSYACRRSFNLTQHMNKHVLDKPRADRPHTCLMCNRTFTTDAMLTFHINKHEVSFLEIKT